MSLPTPHGLPITAHVMVVEDEPRLAALLDDYLRAAGYSTEVLHHGDEVLPAVQARAPDLLLLDLMLPGRDGLSVCQALRGFSDLPVIMITARVEEVDRLIGLASGADDYICKPFSPREVVARVKTVLRRAQPAPPFTDTHTDRADRATATRGLCIDTEALRATLRGQPLALTPNEFRLLCALARPAGRVFSRDQLLDRLHDDLRALHDRTVDSHIKNLRRKLEQAAPDPDPIRSIYGVGYRLELNDIAWLPRR